MIKHFITLIKLEPTAGEAKKQGHFFYSNLLNSLFRAARLVIRGQGVLKTRISLS